MTYLFFYVLFFYVLVFLAGVAALFGLVSISQATAGVVFTTAACLLAILARIAQAAYHHGEITQMLQVQDRRVQVREQER